MKDNRWTKSELQRLAISLAYVDSSDHYDELRDLFWNYMDRDMFMKYKDTSYEDIVTDLSE